MAISQGQDQENCGEENCWGEARAESGGDPDLHSLDVHIDQHTQVSQMQVRRIEKPTKT